MATERRTAQAGNPDFLRGIMDSSLRAIADDCWSDIAELERALERAGSDLRTVRREMRHRAGVCARCRLPEGAHGGHDLRACDNYETSAPEASRPKSGDRSEVQP